MSKLSVKKPFTVLVGIVMAVVLGFVSLSQMQLDLLPDISLPYLLVLTTYPGASSEKIEVEICQPMEASLGTITGVKNVLSVSHENYGMVQLEFEDDTNIDSAMVKVSSAVNTLKSKLPEDAGTPSIIELSTDMVASVYLGISAEGKEMEELSQLIKDEITPYYERQDGVAQVSTLGLINKSVQVELDQAKVDALNDKILSTVDGAFAKAVDQLNDARQKLVDSQETLDKNRDKLIESEDKLDESKMKLLDSEDELDENAADLKKNRKELESNIKKMEESKKALDDKREETNKQLADLSFQLDQAMQELKSLNTQISAAKADQSAAKSALDAARAAAAADPSDPDKQEAVAAALEAYESAVEKVSSLEERKSAIESSYKELESRKLDAAESLGSADAQMTINQQQLESAKSQLDSAKKQIDSAREQLASSWDALEDSEKQIKEGWDSLNDGQKQLGDGWDDYRDAVKSYQKQRKEAERKANADSLLTLDTLANLIYAQNFEMPAGYVDDKKDNSWLVKVGQNFDKVEDLENVVLSNIHKVGDVKLGDVANITVIDNAKDSYVRMGENKAVVLSIYKSSTTGTNDLSKTIAQTNEKLKERFPEIEITKLADMGDYIDLIVRNVVRSILIGAILAIIVLAIFLKDVKPTMVVAISIPLSVFTALICMYFSGISLNMLSLSGLALGIGMLVDNSIVVIENIYRLRGRGIAAPRAAVQGTRQVAGAIIASTLTTACVFLPMIFTSGIVRDLMAPMSLTIVFCLLASLVVAVTVVPASGSTVLRKVKEKQHPLFDKMLAAYEKALDFCLRRKIVPILTAIGLLVLSSVLVVSMGIVVIPEMTTNQMEATLKFDKDVTREEAYKKTDEVLDRLLKIEGLGTIGVINGGDSSLILAESGTSTDNFRTMSFELLTEDENAGAAEIKRIMNDINAAVADLDLDFTLESSSSETSSLTGGSGLSINIYGDDLDELMHISKDFMEMVGSIEGYKDISNGQEDADRILHLSIDKNAAMSHGFSVAQIYQDINKKLTNEKSSVTIKVDGINMDIKIVDEMKPLTRENLLDYTFSSQITDDDYDTVTEDHKLGEFAKVVEEDGVSAIRRKNQSRYITVSAGVEDGYNTTLLTRQLEPILEKYNMPAGYSYDLGGEYDSVVEMVKQMLLVAGLGLLMVYLVMVAQFQSLLSPFIVLFTVPLAFTGGFLSLILTRENLSVIAIMGLIVLMGTVVNNGIVFVDYTNQLRKGGLDRRRALIATGKTRMRPILMTALTTILAESNLIIGDNMGSQLGKGMALVIAGGLAYATLMTLFIIPVMYDIFYKKQPVDVDTGSDTELDDIPDDAAEFMKEMPVNETI
ncbi:MAG: efflux RND transporter permease subunit [Lachnospiraceae bacterium]|nr:efflux RND transporter permease subunit [Lachnospiraceae bacterium]